MMYSTEAWVSNDGYGMADEFGFDRADFFGVDFTIVIKKESEDHLRIWCNEFFDKDERITFPSGYFRYNISEEKLAYLFLIYDSI